MREQQQQVVADDGGEIIRAWVRWMLVIATVTFLLVYVATVTQAQGVPEQVITVPVEVKGEPGEFLRIPADTKGKIVKWRVLDPGLNLFPVDLLKDTRVAVVTGVKAGKYRVWAWTAIGDSPSDAVQCVVVIGQLPPGPGPGPGPSPPPPIPPPDVPDKHGFVALAMSEGNKVVDGDRAKAAALGENFAAIGAKLAATAMTVEEANLELRTKNRITLFGSDTPAPAGHPWTPFFVAWKARADAGLKSKDDYVAAYIETAAGLKAVR